VKSTTSPARSTTNSPSPRTNITPAPTNSATEASRRLSGTWVQYIISNKGYLKLIFVIAPVCESPTTTSGTGQPKFVQTATKTQKLRELNSRSPSRNNSTETSNTTTPIRSASVLKQPRQNAAMRARAEHSRLQQEEQSSKKNSKTPLVSSASLRLKQKVNSGIDWDTIKRDRRNTVTEGTVSKKE
jgi:hypothetical protein